MTGSAIQVESSNMQNILIAIVVICAIVYGFIEFRRINMRFQELETHIVKLQEVVSSQEKETYVSQPPGSNSIHTKATLKRSKCLELLFSTKSLMGLYLVTKYLVMNYAWHLKIFNPKLRHTS